MVFYLKLCKACLQALNSVCVCVVVGIRLDKKSVVLNGEYRNTFIKDKLYL